MREYGSNINLPSLDNLFSSEQERQDAKLEKIQILPLTELHPFRNHPFQVRDDDEMDKMQALHDGCDIVGGSIDERGGWLLRPGYRDMMQQIKGGKVDRVYICRMRQISGKERHLYSFFKRLMQHGVQVTAMEYSLRDRVNMFRLARRVERYATRKRRQLPW